MPNLILGQSAKEAAKLRFRSFNLTLPGGAQNPLSLSPNFPKSQVGLGAAGSLLSRPGGAASGRGMAAGSPPPAMAAPMQFPPALFKSASNSKADVDNQKAMHDKYNAAFDGILDAIEFGFNMYRLTAGLVDVRIDGPVAIGGRLQGPALDGLISRAPSVAAWSDWNGMVRDAVAKGIEMQWSILARSTCVPGLPWYPAFAAFPGPQVPPMPNVPTPFIALTGDPTAMLPANLKTAMRASLRGNMDFSSEFFDSVATALQIPLQLWKTGQMVTNVLGMGPVPTFAPPYVPVGAVVGGTILPGQHISS
jgi:hypothetical protein